MASRGITGSISDMAVLEIGDFKSASFEENIYQSLIEMQSTERGSYLYEMLQTDKTVYRISEAISASWYDPKTKTMYINTTEKYKIVTDMGIKVASPTRQIAHEMGHAFGYSYYGDNKLIEINYELINIIRNENATMYGIEGFNRINYTSF